MFVNKKLIGLSKGARKNIMHVTVITCFVFFVSIAQAFYISKMISALINCSGLFLHYFLLFICCIIIQAVLKRPAHLITATCEENIKKLIRTRLLNKLTDLGLIYLNDQRTGDATVAVLDRVEALAPYYSTYIPYLATVLFVSTGTLIYIAFIKISIAFCAFVGMLGVLVLPVFTYKYLWSTGDEVWNEYAKFGSDFLDNLQGMATLKNLKACSIKRKEMEKLAKTIHRKTMNNMKITTIENFLFELSADLGSVISIGYAAFLASRGELQTIHLLLILFLTRSCFTPVYALMNAWHLGYNGVAASSKIFEILSEPAVVWRQNFQIDGNKKYLCVENLSFSYGNVKVLDSISLELRPGTVNALIGKSGEGKSTLASVIAGLYPYTSGKIYDEEEGLSGTTVSNWYSKIGAVWQEPYIFNGSFRENLQMAKPTAVDSELYEAIEKANLKNVLANLPEGLDTMLGEKGSRLSGGEKQRVAIARCFLKDASILIFDEATSSLDEKNQTAIQNSINTLIKGKTVLVIAHRLSTVEKADVIYMMKNGKIICSGTHRELLSCSPEYTELIRNQK